MPIYEYRCGACGHHLEALQKMTEAPLDRCPQCGGPVQRVLSLPSVHGVGSSKNVLSNKNLADKGFTKYVKAGDGHYEKAAGKGPDVIKR